MRHCIGMDVAKQFFDVYCLGSKQDQRFANDAVGIQQCVTLCRQVRPDLIVMEATGGYESLLAGHLQAAGLPVAVVNPRRIRDFAKAVGQIARIQLAQASE